MVKAQKYLLDHLGIIKLLAVIGGSMGGMQVLQFASLYPDKTYSANSCSFDKSGQSKTFNTIFDFPDGGDVTVTCTDWGEDIINEYKWDDNLQVEISHKEYTNFINYEFYK